MEINSDIGLGLKEKRKNLNKRVKIVMVKA